MQKNKDFAGDKDAQLEPALVQEFVRFSHFNFDTVKKMVESTPELVTASWDWGGGDFETGLGAASHVGNKKIALYLLEQGARPDIFTSAMLGQLDAVKSLIDSFPYLKDCKGPHGLSLIHHAEKGGDEAKTVLEYLKIL
ncbi:MAG: ankyrin repeat domain-containing protein [Calditrichaeota bacterium]|nr:MAG: ankyrin repeat domain-containing protein [Calditrichota bacterium]